MQSEMSQRTLQTRTSITAELQALEKRISSADTDKRITQLGSVFRATSTVIKTAFDDLELRVNTLEISSNPLGSLGVGTDPSRASKVEMNSLKAVVDGALLNLQHTVPSVPQDVINRIAELELAALDRLQGETSAEGYPFENVTFHSAEDVLKKLGKSIEDVNVGMFVEMFGITCRLEDTFASGKDYADKMKATTSVHMTTLEADNMATMAYTTIPYFFEKVQGKNIPVEQDAGFGQRLETFAKFRGGLGKSTKTDLSARVTRVITMVKGSIIGTDMSQRLARHLLSEVNVQVGLVLAFFGDYYDVLTDECHYTPKAAWTFIGVSFRAICEHLLPPPDWSGCH